MTKCFPCSYLILGSSIHCCLNTFLQYFEGKFTKTFSLRAPKVLCGCRRVCSTGTISPHTIYTMHRIFWSHKLVVSNALLQPASTWQKCKFIFDRIVREIDHRCIHDLSLSTPDQTKEFAAFDQPCLCTFTYVYSNIINHHHHAQLPLSLSETPYSYI